MSRIFYELEQAAEKLGVDVAEIESMIDLRELPLVQVGERRLVHVRDVDGVAQRVERGGPLRVRREYRGAMIPEAVREAARHLGVPEEALVYEVLEKAQLRMPGIEGRPARIAVTLPEGATDFPEDSEPDPPAEEEPSAEQVIRRSGNVRLYEVLRTEAARSNTSDAEAPLAGETSDPAETPEPGASETVGTFYAPEQVARLLGRKPSEVNLWIYRRDLPTVNINGYLWIPEAAVLERLEREPSPATGTPPKPFRLVVPSEETHRGSYVYRLGEGEVADEESPEALRQRVTELERLVEDLRGQILRDAPTVPGDIPADETPSENGHNSLDHAHSA